MEFQKQLKKIYVLSGKARSGKDTVAGYIKELLPDKKIICLAYASTLKDYAKQISNWDGSEETKPRELLQELGTTLIRKQIDSNMLVRRIMEDIEVYSYFYEMVIITDARLEEEVITPVKQFGFVSNLHLIRNTENELTEKQQKHLTETGLDSFHNYDYVIDNNGTLEELKEKVKEILIKEGEIL